MLSLPTELIIGILEDAYYNEQGEIDRETMSSCSLVCHSMSEPGQRLLFHNVQLRKCKSIGTIHGSPERIRKLGSLIRRLDVTISKSQEASVAEFVDVISYCPNLYELILRIDGIHEFDIDIINNLSKLALGPPTISIRSLFLHSFGIQSPIPYQLLSVWPSIQFLRLGTELAAPHPRRDPPNFRLYELSLLRTPSGNSVEWLLGASEGHLRILDFRDPPGVRYDPILAIHGPHLISLRLFRHTARTSAVIRHCPNLKELVIVQFSSFIPLVRIPESLEHLSFRNYSWGANATLMPIINAIDRLPNLRLVSCDLNGGQHGDTPKLILKCNERGIELRMDAPPIYIHEDPVPIHAFPRGRSVSNFHFMNRNTTDRFMDNGF